MKFAALSLALALAAPSAADASMHPTVWTGQVKTFANGARIKTEGSTLTITTPDGKSSVVRRSDPDFMSIQSAPPPRAMSCASLAQTIQLAPLTNRAWRRAVMTYALYC